MSIIERYMEVKQVCPIDKLAEQTKQDNQSLFGNVLDWLRDYYNQPKCDLWGLATYMVGAYAVDHFLQDELVNKVERKK